ncbi:MAG TPA: SDR family NAD(P)-dependent oxidoreductase [Ilumatobacteraceae bacterium]|nr:SDR family NAD(P)-dependent oxidoreductase [Ilumatobacteraceae bacterium]
MGERLAGKVAVVVGGGQTPGDTIGNGRATAITFAREGARVLVVDRDHDSAQETVAMIAAEGGESIAHGADITDPDACGAIPDAALAAFGALDILHNNVGIGAGDQPATRVDEDAWQRIFDVNLSGMWRTCKAVIPTMRAAGHGAIINISSIASICSTNTAAYKISKAGVNSLTEHLAIGVARHGIRVNAILPGLMNTPMAIEGISAARGMDRAELIAQRDAMVPLGRAMGTAWDVANAALFLASDEARFVTGVLLPVDGGQSARRG